MEQVKEFNKKNLDEIRSLINSKLEELQKETGVSFSLGNIGFSTDKFSVTLTAKVEGADQRKWEMYAPHMGFKKEDFGKEFISKGETYKIIGVEPGLKFPIICQKGNSIYKFSESSVKISLK
jgi:hypothetical protein